MYVWNVHDQLPSSYTPFYHYRSVGIAITSMYPKCFSPLLRYWRIQPFSIISTISINTHIAFLYVYNCTQLKHKWKIKYPRWTNLLSIPFSTKVLPWITIILSGYYFPPMKTLQSFYCSTTLIISLYILLLEGILLIFHLHILL